MKPNLNQIMQQAQDMQKKMQDAQKQLAVLEVIGKAGVEPDCVKAYKKGIHFYRIEIADSLLKEDKEILEDMVAAAVNDAITKFEKASRDMMAKMTAGMGLPADFKLDAE
jgi:DNA-binding YbaB/EbfC family protein